MKTISYIFLCFILVACAPATIKSKKTIDVSAPPIQDLSIVIWMGNTPDMKLTATERDAYSIQFSAAFKERFRQIFEKNGISVGQLDISNQPLKSIAALPGNSSDTLITHAKNSHVLILHADSIWYLARYNDKTSPVFLHFNAALWNVQSKQIVWTSIPTLCICEKQPRLKVQEFAGQLLNAMNKDGLIHLKQNTPIDLWNEPITVYPVWINDR